MKTMTLNITDNEMKIVERLCKEKRLTKTGLVRQAIRMYQQITTRIDNGEKFIVESSLHKKELLIIT